MTELRKQNSGVRILWLLVLTFGLVALSALGQSPHFRIQNGFLIGNMDGNLQAITNLAKVDSATYYQNGVPFAPGGSVSLLPVQFYTNSLGQVAIAVGAPLTNVLLNGPVLSNVMTGAAGSSIQVGSISNVPIGMSNQNLSLDYLTDHVQLNATHLAATNSGVETFDIDWFNGTAFAAGTVTIGSSGNLDLLQLPGLGVLYVDGSKVTQEKAFTGTNTDYLSAANTWEHAGGGSFSGDPYYLTTNANNQVTLTNIVRDETRIDAITNLHLDPTGSVPIDTALSNYFATLNTNANINVTIYFPTGNHYIISNEVLFPFCRNPLYTYSIKLIGPETPGSWAVGFGLTNGATIYATNTTVTNIFGSLPGASGQPNNGNLLAVTMENFNIHGVTNNNWTGGMLNFTNWSSPVILKNLIVDTGIANVSLQPFTNTIGITWPQTLCTPLNTGENIAISGFCKGTVTGEFDEFRNCYIVQCTYGIDIGPGGYMNTLDQVGFAQCPQPIGCTGLGGFITGTVDINENGSGWQATYFDVVDPVGRIIGDLTFHDMSRTKLTYLGQSGLLSRAIGSTFFVNYNGNVIQTVGVNLTGNLTNNGLVNFQSSSAGSAGLPAFLVDNYSSANNNFLASWYAPNLPIGDTSLMAFGVAPSSGEFLQFDFITSSSGFGNSWALTMGGETSGYIQGFQNAIVLNANTGSIYFQSPVEIDGTSSTNFFTTNSMYIRSNGVVVAGITNGHVFGDGSMLTGISGGGSGTVTQLNADIAAVVSWANATTTPTPTFSVASPSQLGVVKNDGNSIAVSPAGVISESNYDVWPSGGFTNIEGTTTNICLPGVTYVITPITTNATGATGTTNFFAGNTNVVVSQTGIAVNGGTISGNGLGLTNVPSLQFFTPGLLGGTVSQASTRWLPIEIAVPAAIAGITNWSLYLPGITLLSNFVGTVNSPTLLVGSNIVWTVMTNGNGTGPMSASAMTITTGSSGQINISSGTTYLLLTNATVILQEQLGAGTSIANVNFRSVIHCYHYGGPGQ